jgi:hypothetical protein
MTATIQPVRNWLSRIAAVKLELEISYSKKWG